VKRPWSRTESEAFRLIEAKLRDMANETIYNYSEPMWAEDLYKLLILPGDYLTLKNASMLMQPMSRWSSDNLKVHTYFTPEVIEQIEYNITYESDVSRTNWLWPQYLDGITPVNELGRKLFPILDIAIQWQTTIELYNMFRNTYIQPSLTLHMLPWIKLLIPDIKPHTDSDNRQEVITYLQRMLDMGTPRYVPGVSAWFGQVCKYGSELISLHNMTKGNVHEFKNGQAKMIPVLTEALVEDGLRNHFNEFVKELKNINPRNNDRGVRDIQYGP
jgi:hypothetical protein